MAKSSVLPLITRLALCAVLWAVGALVSGEPVVAQTAAGRIELRLEPKEVDVGSPATLTVALTDFAGEPLVTAEEVTVLLEGGEALGASEVRLPAGTSSAAVELTPSELGTFAVVGRATGYDPGEERLTASRVPRNEEGAYTTSRTPDVPSRPTRVEIPQGLDPAAVDSVARSFSDAGFDPDAAASEAGFSPEMLELRDRLEVAMRDLPPNGRIQVGGATGTGRDSRMVLRELPDRGNVSIAWPSVSGERPTRESLVFGAVRLEVIPQNPRPPRRGDWPAVSIDAIWEPRSSSDHTRREDLEIQLSISDFEGDQPILDRDVLVIPAGRATARERATLDSDSAQVVEILGRWQSSSVTEAISIEFPRPPAAALEFEVRHRVVRGLANVNRLVTLRTVDDQGDPAPVTDDLAVCVLVSTEVGSDEQFCETLPAGGGEVTIEVALTSFGVNILTASADGLESASIEIDYRIAWVLIALALVGGLIGSAAAVALRRGNEWLRALGLGLVSALVAILLAAFDLFDLLSAAIGGAIEIGQRVSMTNALGVLLVALIAGLAFESVIGHFVNRGTDGTDPEAPNPGQPDAEQPDPEQPDEPQEDGAPPGPS